MYIFDAHQDISDAMLYSTHGDFWKHNALHEGWNDLNLPVNNQTDFIRLQKAGVKGVFAVTCAIAVAPDGSIIPCDDHFGETKKHLDLYDRLVKESHGQIQVIRNTQDLENIQEYELSFLLALEGVDGIQNNLQELDYYFDRGIRSIGLTWSFNNNLAGGCNEDGDVTELGGRVIQRMNELGIILDLSHINEKSFYSALAVNDQPAIISHTALKSVYDHERNVTDEQIKAVAKTGGAVGICGVPQFMGRRTLEQVFTHFDKALETVGEDHVIIGTDFGAMTRPDLVENFREVTDTPKLLEFMKSKGYSDRVIQKIAYKNIVRILSDVLPE